MLLTAYDGSSDARAAIRCVAKLMPGEPAMVLTVWDPFINVIARSGAGAFYGWPDDARSAQLDSIAEKAARARAEEGAELARATGLNAQPRTRMRRSTIAEAILDEAEEVHARAIVLGTRGLTGLKSLMLGSVSHAVTVHSPLPVIVVSSATAAHAKQHQSDGAVEVQPNAQIGTKGE